MWMAASPLRPTVAVVSMCIISTGYWSWTMKLLSLRPHPKQCKIQIVGTWCALLISWTISTSILTTCLDIDMCDASMHLIFFWSQEHLLHCREMSSWWNGMRMQNTFWIIGGLLMIYVIQSITVSVVYGTEWRVKSVVFSFEHFCRARAAPKVSLSG